MPKVSLILPIYNVEPYIADCLESLVNQTLKDIEIICINDASPDNSWRIVNEYAAKDKRFVLINLPENHGQGNARNQGLDIARGEYIMFVDSDDWLELNACELAYNQIKQNNNDFVYFGIYLYYEKTGKITQESNRLRSFAEYGEKTFSLKDMEKPNLRYGESCYKIYKKSFLRKNNIRFLEQRFCEDIPFYIQCVVSAKNVSVINKPLYYYRLRSNSSISQTVNWKELFVARNKSLEYVQLSGNYNLLKAYIIAYICSILYWYGDFTTKNKKIARPFYNEMRKAFTALNKVYDIKELKPYIKYSEFRRIIKYTWEEQKLRKVLKTIFSIKKSNDKRHKIITILGIKLKLNREKQQIAKIKRRYAAVLKQLRKQTRNRKIKVAFLVNEIAKWKYQSLYDLLAKSAEFEPVILLTTINNLGVVSLAEQKQQLNKMYDFFADKKMHCEYTLDFAKDEVISINSFNADIVFYQQPWSVKQQHSPYEASRRSLCCYEPYYVPNYGDLKIDCNLVFHKEIFRYYVLTEKWKKLYENSFSGKRAGDMKALGHTMLDTLTQPQQKSENKNYVIYAPHWSIGHIKNPNYVNYSTFDNTGKEILNYAQQHPEINWVFKPHPNLKYALQRIGWSEEEIENYYSEWEKIAKCCYDADYVELFLQSKAMITDCGSFLIEYFVTGKPIIHLISDDCKEVPLEPSKVIFDTFYKAHTLKEMYQHFQDVIIEDNDYMQKQRQDMLAKSGLKGNYAAENIYKDMLQLLNIKK